MTIDTAKLEASALAATTGDWTADDNFGFTIQCYRTGTNRLLATVNGPNAENDMQFIAQASPQNILRVLAERDTDKALIAEQAKRIAELELRLSQQRSVAAHNLEMFRVADAKVSELEARTLTVKLPKLKMLEDYLAEVAEEERRQIIIGVKLEFHRLCKEAAAAAGINLETGE